MTSLVPSFTRLAARNLSFVFQEVGPSVKFVLPSLSTDWRWPIFWALHADTQEAGSSGGVGSGFWGARGPRGRSLSRMGGPPIEVLQWCIPPCPWCSYLLPFSFPDSRVVEVQSLLRSSGAPGEKVASEPHGRQLDSHSPLKLSMFSSGEIICHHHTAHVRALSPGLGAALLGFPLLCVQTHLCPALVACLSTLDVFRSTLSRFFLPWWVGMGRVCWVPWVHSFYWGLVYLQMHRWARIPPDRSLGIRHWGTFVQLQMSS